MTDPERKEAIVHLILSGLGFDLERELGTYAVTDRRAAPDLPGAMQPATYRRLEAIVTLFAIEV
jgi:hypothetical protein